MSNNIFPAIRAGYDIMWKNTVQPDKPQQTVQYRSNMAHAHCTLGNECYRHTFRIKVKVKLALEQATKARGGVEV